MSPDCKLIVFAKAPEPGFAKTRLAAAIGPVAAARLAARMFDATLAAAVNAGLGRVQVCCTPDTSHPAFRQAALTYPLELVDQGDGDLGERMHRALVRALRHHARAVLIGTDIPQLDAQLLRDAAAALETHDAVFAPAADGGYVLVGLSMPMPELFAGIDWSTSRVMEQTRHVLLRHGITAYELPMLHDVDEPQDLLHVPQGWLD